MARVKGVRYISFRRGGAAGGRGGGRGEILTFPDTLTTQGLSLWSLNKVGGEILTFPDTRSLLCTQGLSLWRVSLRSVAEHVVRRAGCRPRPVLVTWCSFGSLVRPTTPVRGGIIRDR